MISWKYSFEKVSRELELAKKKKQALDDLFNTGKISQPTYDDLNKGFSEAIAEIEARQKFLAEKMAAKITELEHQIQTLERFLANTEIEYAAGEIDEELHERESNALTLGLETAKQQLDVIKEAMTDLFSEETELVSPPPPAETVEEASEETLETPPETRTEAPAEVSEEVEPVTEEASTEEESFSSPEEPVEETVTVEVAEIYEDVETSESAEDVEVVEPEVADEETSEEEFSSYQDEEEASLEAEEEEE